MKVSSGIAGIVIICTEPRAPISMEMDETVSLSGASRMVTKSYGPEHRVLGDDLGAPAATARG